MHTGENELGLRKIIEMTRLISIVLLVLHLYFYCYKIFEDLEWRATIVDRLLVNVAHTGLFSYPLKSKAIALLFLILSLLGAKGKKTGKIGA